MKKDESTIDILKKLMKIKDEKMDDGRKLYKKSG